MRSLILLLAFFLAAVPAAPQRHKLTVDATTPEGQQLQDIGKAIDDNVKLKMLEEFIAKYPRSEAATWVYSQMQPLYVKAKQYGKAIEVGDKLLTLDPLDAETAQETLKAAEAMKDPDLIRTWAIRTSDTARRVVATPKPADEQDAEDWKRDVDFARQLDVYTEYALFDASLQASDPKKKIELAETLESRSPQSKYIAQITTVQFVACQQIGDKEKAVALAEKMIEANQGNEDMLLVAADYYMNRKQPEKVINYSGKLVEIMQTKPKPPGFSDADWDKKKKLSLGLGYWMIGVTYSNQGKFVPADKALRESLPYIQGNAQLLAPALFHLGLVNFRLGDTAKGDQKRILDAYRFTKECAAMSSPFQAQARKNLLAIRSKYSIR